MSEDEGPIALRLCLSAGLPNIHVFPVYSLFLQIASSITQNFRSLCQIGEPDGLSFRLHLLPVV